jgi:hypothetical protein
MPTKEEHAKKLTHLMLAVEEHIQSIREIGDDKDDCGCIFADIADLAIAFADMGGAMSDDYLVACHQRLSDEGEALHETH